MTSDIRRFITQYIFAGLIGTLIVVFAVPFVNRAALPPAFDAIDSTLRLIPGVPEASAWICRHLQWSVIRQTAAQAIKPPAVAPAPAPVVRAPPRPPPPPPAAPRKQGHWAVVKGARASCYNANGKFISRLVPGTLADVREIRKTVSGDLAVCRIPNGKSADTNILIFLRDLDIQTGALDGADMKEVELRIDRARLRAELEQLKQNPVRTLRTDNPHAAAYSAADGAYKEYLNKARKLQAQRDAAVGDDRMQVGDEMRKIKSEDLRLSTALTTAKRKYEDWNATHPSSASPSGIRQTEAKLAKINAELERISLAKIEAELEK